MTKTPIPAMSGRYTSTTSAASVAAETRSDVLQNGSADLGGELGRSTSHRGDAAATANGYRNLLANRTRNTNGYFVRNANWNSLADGDRLLFAYWNANGVRNLAANVFANIAAHGVALSLALRNHRAGSVANIFGALFANPLGYAVLDSASTALRNHLASG